MDRTHLDRLPSPMIDECKSEVVTGNKTTDGENDVPNGDIVKRVLQGGRWVVRSGRRSETDGLKNDGRV